MNNPYHRDPIQKIFVMLDPLFKLKYLIGFGITLSPLQALEITTRDTTPNLGAENADRSFSYTNPITRDPSQSLRDHMILKVGDRWYMTGSSHPIWGGPNPGVRLMESDDLLNWKDAGWCIDSSKLPKDCPYNGRFWAPELHQIQGKFYLCVNSGHEGPKAGTSRLDDHRVWIFESEDIKGPYKVLTTNGLVLADPKIFTNDGTMFADDDGRTYVYCGGDGLWQAEIDLKTGKLMNEDDGSNGFKKVIGHRDPGSPDWMIGGIEGPWVMKRHGCYWMFCSGWARGYEVGMLRADRPLGPWKLVQQEPIFGTRKRAHREVMAKKDGYPNLVYEDTKDPYVEVGHNAVFEGPDGKDWICCHYWLQGKSADQSEFSGLIPVYDTREQLGIEPLTYGDEKWHVNGPTWTPQEVKWKTNQN